MNYYQEDKVIWKGSVNLGLISFLTIIEGGNIAISSKQTAGTLRSVYLPRRRFIQFGLFPKTSDNSDLIITMAIRE